MPTSVRGESERIYSRCRERLASLAARGAIRVPPSLPGVLAFLETADECFVNFAARANLDAALTSQLRALALRDSLPAFVGVIDGSVRASADALCVAWNHAASTLGLRRVRLSFGRRLTVTPRAPSVELVLAFEAGLIKLVSSISSTTSGATAIRRLMSHLELSYDEVGRMFDVTGETVRRWEQGISSIPPDKQAALAAAGAALSGLLGIFQPDALASVIRTPAEIFGNERALDWILRGRIAEVVQRYDATLSYQL